MKTEALQQVTVLETTWTNCPENVITEIEDLWSKEQLYNGSYYLWNFDNEWYNDELEQDTTVACMFPLTAKYLKDREVDKCLIHFWW